MDSGALALLVRAAGEWRFSTAGESCLRVAL
jgi:hypothetical protein